VAYSRTLPVLLFHFKTVVSNAHLHEKTYVAQRPGLAVADARNNRLRNQHPGLHKFKEAIIHQQVVCHQLVRTWDVVLDLAFFF
jgi:hypothetical protein